MAWLSSKTSSGVPRKEGPFLSCPSHSVGSRDQGKQGEDWNEDLDRELHPQCPDWGLTAAPHPEVGVGTPTFPPRPLSTARASSPQLPPFLPPRSHPAAPPQPRGPGRPGGSAGTHTSLPVPPAPPGAKARSRGGSGVSRPSRGAGAPAGPRSGAGLAGRALRPTGERGAASRPESPRAALPTGLGRAEPPKAQGGGGAERLREPCEGKEASVTGQRRSRSKQTPAACPEQCSGSTPGWPRCGLPWARQPSRSPLCYPWKGLTLVAGG